MSYKSYKSNPPKPSSQKTWGGYKKLASYQTTEIIYDLTIEFCQKYINFKSRTKDQMEQAARSGKQNIVEGSTASQTSKKTEIKLMGVARASLSELLEDFQDFLRQKGFLLWDKNSQEVKKIRSLAYLPYKSYTTYKIYTTTPERAANCAICLINQATYLLDHQIQSLEKQFLEQSGYTENLFKKRLANREAK